MIAKTISACIVTNKVKESTEFYKKHFDATVTFDCGWYVNLKFGDDSSTLQFMEPQQPDQKEFSGGGLVYNFNVKEVDLEYEKLTSAGLNVIMPLEDHPWGDRGFSIVDPNGIMLYVYSDREVAEEFQKFFKD